MSVYKINMFDDTINELINLTQKVGKINELYLLLEEEFKNQNKLKSDRKASSILYEKNRPCSDDYAFIDYDKYLDDVSDYNYKNKDLKKYVISCMGIQSSDYKIKTALKNIKGYKENIQSYNGLKHLFGIKTTNFNSPKRWFIIHKKLLMLLELYKEQKNLMYILRNNQYSLLRNKKMVSNLKDISFDNYVTDLHKNFNEQNNILKNSKRILSERYKINKDTIALIKSGHLDKTFL